MLTFASEALASVFEPVGLVLGHHEAFAAQDKQVAEILRRFDAAMERAMDEVIGVARWEAAVDVVVTFMEDQPPGRRGERELDDEQPQQQPGGTPVEAQREDQRNAHQCLASSEQDFLDLAGVEHQGRSAAAQQMCQRQRPDQQRPLVDLG